MGGLRPSRVSSLTGHNGFGGDAYFMCRCVILETKPRASQAAVISEAKVSPKDTVGRIRNRVSEQAEMRAHLPVPARSAPSDPAGTEALLPFSPSSSPPPQSFCEQTWRRHSGGRGRDLHFSGGRVVMTGVTTINRSGNYSCKYLLGPTRARQGSQCHPFPEMVSPRFCRDAPRHTDGKQQTTDGTTSSYTGSRVPWAYVFLITALFLKGQI